MKNVLFLLVLTLSTHIFGITSLNNPETLIEDSQKIMEQENLSFRALSAYGYIYNVATTTPQVINSRQPIPFTSHSNLVGITHTASTLNPITPCSPNVPGSPNIGLVAAGTYFVSFVVYAIQANQFALFLQQGTNAVNAPVCNTNYGVGAAYSPNSGFAIIQTTVANSILTLVNYTPYISQVNTQGNIGTTIVGSTTLAYFGNTGSDQLVTTVNGACAVPGLACNGPVNTSVANTFSSFNGGLQVNTINAAVLVQKLD